MAIQWGAVAQWLERATDNRVVAGSNPAEAVWKLWQFPLPHFASVDEWMCVYEDLHGKKWLYTYGAILKILY